MGEIYRFVKVGALHPEAERGLGQRVAGALSSVEAGTTLLVRGEDNRSVSRWFVAPGGGAERRAFALAKSLHARSERVDEVPDLRGGSLARLEWVPSKSAVVQAAPQAGLLQPVADVLDEALLPGEWVAVSLRAPTSSERARWRRWLRFQRGSTLAHPSEQPTSRVVSMWASSGDAARAAALVDEVTAVLGGFDLVASAVPVTAGSVRRKASSIVLLTVVAAVASWVVPSVLPGAAVDSVGNYVQQVTDGDSAPVWAGLMALRAVLSVAAFVGLAWLIGGRFGWLPDPWGRLQAQLVAGRVPVPARRLRPPAAPRAESSKFTGTGDERREVVVPAREGDYPLHESAFLVGPEFAAALMLPGSSVTSGSVSTRTRNAPPPLLQPIGPQVGEQDGAPVYLSLDDLFAGVFAIGRPQSGKTALLEWLLAESWRDRSFASLSTVAFDTKGDSALSRRMVRWGEWAGEKVHVIRLADETVRLPLDIFGGRGIPERTTRIIAAMKYVEQAGVGPQTEETLRAVLPLAHLVTDAMAESVPGLESGKSAIYYAHVLTGGRGYDLAQRLYEAVAATSDDPLMPEAKARAQILFGQKISESTHRSQASSARNKLDSMVQADAFWKAGERANARDWSAIFGGAGKRSRHVVFDFAGLDDTTVEDLAQFLLFQLRQGIREHCAGFQDQRRVVQVLADEVKAIAASSADVVTWFRSDGRSFGVRALFATQRPTQLPDQVRTELLGFGTIIAYGQDDGGTASSIAAQFSKDSAPWSKDDIETLPQWNAAVYTMYRQQRQAAFTVQVPDFAARELS